MVARPPNPEQPALPLDLDPDESVPYRLTAKAVRVVAPTSLPALRVVADDGTDVPEDLDDPHDPRSARARALRRAGVAMPAIARELDVDEIVVASWVRELAPQRRRLRAVSSSPAIAAADEPGDDAQAALRARFAHARADAAVEAPDRLASPDFTRGLALTVAAADLDAHACIVTIRDLTVGAAVVRWLRDHAGADDRDLRIVLRLGTAQGADLTEHRWAEALGVSPSRFSHTRWRTAPSPDAVEALVRVGDPDVAGRIAGWRDVLLGTDDLDRPDHDVAF